AAGHCVRDREQWEHTGAVAVHSEEWERDAVCEGGVFGRGVERVTVAGDLGDLGVRVGVSGGDAVVDGADGDVEGFRAGAVQHVRQHHDQQGDGAGDGHDDAVRVHGDGDGAGPDVLADGRGAAESELDGDVRGFESVSGDGVLRGDGE